MNTFLRTVVYLLGMGISFVCSAESIQVRYMEFSVMFKNAENGDAWKSREKDCAPLIRELLTCVESRKAKVLVDEYVDLVESDRDYLLHTYFQSNICHAVSSNGVIRLQNWPEPAETKLLARKTFYPTSKGEKLVIEFWSESTKLKSRNIFDPQPSLLAGEPIMETAKRMSAGFYWEDRRLAWFLGHSVVDGLATICICQVSPVQPDADPL